MPPASLYRPLRPAIKAAPPPPQGDSEPSPTPKRKRETVAVACNNCRSRKIACDGKRPLCGQCARRRPASPRACGYSDKHETHAALRRRIEALEAEVAAHENTLSLLVNLPDDEALRLLRQLKSMRPPPPPRPPPQNDDEPPWPFSSSCSSSLLPDGVDAPPGTYHDDRDDHGGHGGHGDHHDHHDHDDDDDDDETDDSHANPIPPADDAALPLPTINPHFDSSWSQGPVQGFAYPPPMPDTGRYLYPYEDDLSAPGGLPTAPTAEPDMQWRDLYLK